MSDSDDWEKACEEQEPKKEEKNNENRSVIPYKASLGKLRFRVQKIRFRDQKRRKKRIQNRSVILYKASNFLISL